MICTGTHHPAPRSDLECPREAQADSLPNDSILVGTMSAPVHLRRVLLDDGLPGSRERKEGFPADGRRSRHHSEHALNAATCEVAGAVFTHPVATLCLFKKPVP